MKLYFQNYILKLATGNGFLLFDSGPVLDRIIIFATQRNLNLLARSQHWYADGTFKTAPHLFAQLYTFHGLQENIAIPLIFALLPSKTENTSLLREIKTLQPLVNPQTILTDFESAMIKAISTEFPQSTHRGCFFHFGQCIYRCIQANGLKQRSEIDGEFALAMKLLFALAFVPVEHVITSFESLCDNCFPEEAQPVVDYFEDTWIGRPNRRQHRRVPRFSITM